MGRTLLCRERKRTDDVNADIEANPILERVFGILVTQFLYVNCDRGAANAQKVHKRDENKTIPCQKNHMVFGLEHASLEQQKAVEQVTH
jgi:hypothetical protein